MQCEDIFYFPFINQVLFVVRDFFFWGSILYTIYLSQALFALLGFVVNIEQCIEKYLSVVSFKFTST